MVTVFAVFGVIFILLIIVFAIQNNQGKDKARQTAPLLHSVADTLSESLKEFQDGYNKEQKAAIVGSLIVFAKVGESLTENESQYIETVRQMLGIDYNDSVFQRAIPKGAKHMTSVLQTLNRPQRIGYLKHLTELMCIGGKSDFKIKFLMSMTDDLGFTHDEYLSMNNAWQPAIAQNVAKFT